MNTYTTIRFGLGEVISDCATVGEIPAVTLESSKDEPGVVGEPGPHEPNLREGAIVLEFHHRRGAEILIEDIVKAHLKKDENLSMFLRHLATLTDQSQSA